jgi:hypothetical protein
MAKKANREKWEEGMAAKIHRLASEYAERKCPGWDYLDRGKCDIDREIRFDEAMEVLTWLFARPVDTRLTEKETLQVWELFRRCQRLDEKNRREGRAEADTCTVLKSIFGNKIFQPRKKQQL